MTYHIGYSKQHEYEDSCAVSARYAQQMAEACNAILTLRQADFALACFRQNPVEAIALVEDLFDAHGWPSDDLDAAWLDEAGRITWELFRAYRVGAA